MASFGKDITAQAELERLQQRECSRLTPFPRSPPPHAQTHQHSWATQACIATTSVAPAVRGRRMSTHRYEERLKALNEDPDGHGFKASNSPVLRHVALQRCATRCNAAQQERRSGRVASAFPEGGAQPTATYRAAGSKYHTYRAAA